LAGLYAIIAPLIGFGGLCHDSFFFVYSRKDFSARAAK
jgi:hypothetical protein